MTNNKPINKPRKALAIAALTMLSFIAKAQSPMADVYLKSPSMASLGEYGEHRCLCIQVSHQSN